MLRAKHVLTFLFLLGMMSSATFAALPPDQAVRYTIYDDPYDSNREAVFRVTLSLHAEDEDTNGVGWDVTHIGIVRENKSSGNTGWGEDNPFIDTADGLWWVDHDDKQSPRLDEFDAPPLMEGTAALRQGSEPDLDYSVEGSAYTASPPLFGGNVSSLTFRFAQEGEPEEPEEEGEEEPTEIDPPNDPD